MRFERHQSAVVLASVLTVLAFVGITVYTQYRLTAVDHVSSTIATNAVPSLEYLGRSLVRLQTLRPLIADAVGASSAPAETVPLARAELQALQSDIDGYLRLTPLHGEDELWNATRRDLDGAETAAHQVLEAVERADGSAPARFRTEFVPALDRAAGTMRAAMDFDVKESERLAREVGDVRRTTSRTITILDAVATGIAGLLALLALQSARDHDRLLQAHNALLSDRVTELDRFAGRVAHDILSPLDTVGMGLALVTPSADAGARAHIERSQRALQRVKQLVEGLLRFARSGVRTDADGQAAVDAVLKNVALDYADAARAAGIEIVVESSERIDAACSVAVLTSIVQNLVSNAIKYMGDSPARWVRVSARAGATRVSVEVADSGPGIPADVQAHMFDPFVRGPHAEIGGIGLGLATVKRLAEAHGGLVEVESTVGVGTRIRVQLPLVTEPPSRAH
jgi:signal transduction histidine kinase